VASNKLSRVTNNGSIRVISQRAMRTASARLATFSGWRNEAVAPHILSSAGFFYRGVDDQAQCISCFLVISQWGSDHDPWREHRRHGPTCELVVAHAEPRSDLPEMLREAAVCKICYDEPMTVLFRPCGHLLTCRSCAQQLSNCPICRQSILEYIRAYVSYQ